MNYGCVPRNDEVFCYTSLIFVDVHDVEFCCFPTFTKLFQENQLSQQWFFFGKKLLSISHQQNLPFKSMSGWKKLLYLDQVRFPVCIYESEHHVVAKKYLHKTFTYVFAYCYPDRYVIVTRYFVLDDIFRRVQFLNIIERCWLPKNSK